MSSITIEGYDINLDHDLLKAKNLKDLKSKNPDFFGHLNDEDKEKAYNLLWNKISPKSKEEKTE